MERAADSPSFSVSFLAQAAAGASFADELIRGPQAIAGEWGHMSINPDGPVCYCGQRGCIETYISGSGVEARYAERCGEMRSLNCGKLRAPRAKGRGGHAGVLSQLWQGHGEPD